MEEENKMNEETKSEAPVDSVAENREAESIPETGAAEEEIAPPESSKDECDPENETTGPADGEENAEAKDAPAENPGEENAAEDESAQEEGPSEEGPEDESAPCDSLSEEAAGTSEESPSDEAVSEESPAEEKPQEGAAAEQTVPSNEEPGDVPVPEAAESAQEGKPAPEKKRDYGPVLRFVLDILLIVLAGSALLLSQYCFRYISSIPEEEEETEITAADAIQSVIPSLVQIHGYIESDLGLDGYDYSWEECGTGFVYEISEDEVIIVGTQDMVETYSGFDIIFADGESYSAEIGGTGEGLGILYVSGLSDETLSRIQAASLGNADALSIGDVVYAVGYSEEYGIMATGGMVSASSGSAVVTDAYFTDEMTGGLLIDSEGNAVCILTESAAVSAGNLIETIESLSSVRVISEAERGYLNIAVTDVSEEASSVYGIPTGAYVAKVYSGASEGMLQAGDVIIMIDDAEVTCADDLTGQMAYYKIGDVVSVTVMRYAGGEYTEETFEITLLGNE